jgi:quercetin dioxygenase-like cupin family protein
VSLEVRARALLDDEGLAASAWSNGPGDRYAAHRHAFDKVLVAVRGTIVFRLPELGRDLDLRAGDRLHLPAGTLHAADVGPAGVVCLEAHLAQGVLGAEPELQAGWVGRPRPG